MDSVTSAGLANPLRPQGRQGATDCRCGCCQEPLLSGYSVLLLPSLIPVLLLDADTLLFALHVVPEESDNSRELCAFSLLFLIYCQTAGLELLIGVRVILLILKGL